MKGRLTSLLNLLGTCSMKMTCMASLGLPMPERNSVPQSTFSVLPPYSEKQEGSSGPTEQPFMNSCGSLLKTTSFIKTTAMGQQGLSEDHCLHSNHRTARRQYRGLSEDHSLHPNHRTAVGQHVRPSEDHSLHPNHWTDHLRRNDKVTGTHSHKLIVN